MFSYLKFPMSFIRFNSVLHKNNTNNNNVYGRVVTSERRHWAATHFCMGLSSTRMINSLLSGMSLSTSIFSRRSMCGARRSCRRATCSSLFTCSNSIRKSSMFLQYTTGVARASDR